METEDGFLRRADWWVGMRIADAVNDRVSIRVLFPSGLSYKTIASLKYVNETPTEKKTTDGVLVENERRTDVAWSIDVPEPTVHVSNPMGLEKVRTAFAVVRAPTCAPAQRRCRKDQVPMLQLQSAT